MSQINKEVSDDYIEGFIDSRFSKPPERPLSAEQLQAAAKADQQEDGFEDKRFGQIDRGGPRAPATGSLKDMLSSLSEEEVLSALADSKDAREREKALAELRDIAQGQAAKEFLEANPDYYACDENYKAITERLYDNGVEAPFTAADLQTAYEQLIAEGALEMAPGSCYQLSEDQLLEIARLAQQGRTADSIGLFLHYSLPDFSPAQLRQVANDSDYIPLCNESVYYTFTHCTQDYIDNDANRQFLMRFVGNKPYTLSLLQTAWAACKQYKVAAKTRVPEPTREVIAQDLNNLSDAEVADTLKAVTQLRQKARGF
jgi:hypothetical protein